ncbi:hypothetical protein AKJ51_00905 [candidate division MSBL1 archaeon SCGC-AAA382A20]|uniref:Haloacid dehalogenase n=1 Tax=candidate division MSBL1 archaeon SCGC-AAA382A20 TaxID=1698280 RepID=A0A133VMD9_9EURY|nr:hypothetical protein AKJ51_00905 [candidate division MSBL1 archaeon SCGC-AAA382A20]
MAVLFDLDGTILGFYRDKSKVRNECARKYGVSEIAPEEYYYAMRKVIQNSKINDREPVFEQIVGDSKVARKIAQDYEKRSLENSFVHEDAEEVLSGIKSKKGLVTNGPRSTQWRKIKKFDLEKYFDSVVVSGEVGKSKPGKEIFEIVLNNLESSPDESIYVGNVPELDVVGANNAGLVSVLINRECELCRGDNRKFNPKPDYEIRDLRELYGIVNS